MLLYGYEVSYDTSDIKQHKFKLLKESKTLLVKHSYILELVNNQKREVSISSDKPFIENQTNQTINFLVKDVVVFSAQKGQNTIYYRTLEKGNDVLVKYWLTHTFLPILFTIENVYYFLHSGAVEVDLKPILFVADSFGGKSTITDFFIKKGHPMISDDKVAVSEDERGVIVTPSYPYHRPYRKVEDLGYFVENFVKESRLINSIFNLIKVGEKEQIKIEEVFGIEKFKILKCSTEIELELNCKARFEMLSKIANSVKVYNITIPWDLDRLEEVYQAIIEHNKKG